LLRAYFVVQYYKVKCKIFPESIDCPWVPSPCPLGLYGRIHLCFNTTCWLAAAEARMLCVMAHVRGKARQCLYLTVYNYHVSSQDTKQTCLNAIAYLYVTECVTEQSTRPVATAVRRPPCLTTHHRRLGHVSAAPSQKLIGR